MDNTDKNKTTKSSKNKKLDEVKKYNSLTEFNKDLDELQKILDSYINQYHKK